MAGREVEDANYFGAFGWSTVAAVTLGCLAYDPSSIIDALYALEDTAPA